LRTSRLKWRKVERDTIDMRGLDTGLNTRCVGERGVEMEMEVGGIDLGDGRGMGVSGADTARIGF